MKNKKKSQHITATNPLDEASSLYKAGLKHNSLRHHDEALVYFQQSLKTLLDNGLVGNELTEQVIIMIADSYDAIANAQPENLQYRIDSIGAMQAVFPEVHPTSAAQIARILNNLADTCHKLGKYSEALEYFSQSINILRSKFPYGSHPYMKTIRENISSLCAAVNDQGVSHFSLGRYNEALACFNQTFHVLQTAFPEGHPLAQVSRENVMKILVHFHSVGAEFLKSNNKEEALKIFVKISDALLQNLVKPAEALLD